MNVTLIIRHFRPVFQNVLFQTPYYLFTMQLGGGSQILVFKASEGDINLSWQKQKYINSYIKV